DESQVALVGIGQRSNLTNSDIAVADQVTADFFRDFGLYPSGTEYQRFEASIERLEHLAIHVHVVGEREEDHWFPRAAPQSTDGREPCGVVRRSGKRLELDPDFWSYLERNSVPTPLGFLRRFHARPKAWDLATLVLYRTFAARHASVIPWSELRDQMGSEDQSRGG
ncbi:MAG: hypothetical protein HC938_17605, partial [Nitrospira sp.]|nr:hypothetical protein [Nitrospira sp.]